MAAPSGLRDLTWDSAGTQVSIVLGILRVPFTKFSPGKMSIKLDKPAIVGESLPTKRTIGKGELAAFGGEILATHYQDLILPRMPKHGGTLIQFPILVTIKHPSITGTLKILLDDCRIIEIDGPELDGSEKALIYKLQFDAMRRYDMGLDGNWRGLAYDPRRASADARAIMQF